MKKFIILISCIAFFALTASQLYALNVGGAIDAFKTRHEKILFESLPFTASGANDILEQEYKMNGLKALETRLAEVEKYYGEKKQEVTQKRLTLEAALTQIENAIKVTEQSIADTEGKIIAKQQKVEALNIASMGLQRKIASHRKILLDYLANMYSEGNLIFDENGDVDMAKALILTDKETDYYLQDITYKAIASQLGQQFVDEYRALVREYYSTKLRTYEEKTTLEQLQKYLHKQNDDYNAQKEERQKLIEITK